MKVYFETKKLNFEHMGVYVSTERFTDLNKLNLVKFVHCSLILAQAIFC